MNVIFFEDFSFFLFKTDFSMSTESANALWYWL